MPGKNVALRREAVNLLDGEKRPGESYSDVVLRLAGRPRSLLELADFLESLPPIEDDTLDRRIHQMRLRERRLRPRRVEL